MHELTAGDLHVVIDAATGGAIVSFTAAGFAVLRPVADFRLEAEHGHAVGAYPLIPYANRVAQARFTFGGENFRLGLNFAGHPHSLHGNAWMREWSVVAASAERVQIDLTYVAPDQGDGAVTQWPFSYRAEQIFSLDPGGLTVAMSVRNLDGRPFPAGIGLHPYVAREAGTLLRFHARDVWRNGPDDLPSEEQPVSGHWDFAQGREIGDGKIDECYVGWDGRAQVVWPSRGLRLTLGAKPPLGHLQLYTPPGHGYFGLEPVSHMPDAVHRPDQAGTGLIVLAPGEELAGSMRFTIDHAQGFD